MASLRLSKSERDSGFGIRDSEASGFGGTLSPAGIMAELQRWAEAGPAHDRPIRDAGRPRCGRASLAWAAQRID